MRVLVVNSQIGVMQHLLKGIPACRVDDRMRLSPGQTAQCENPTVLLPGPARSAVTSKVPSTA